MADCYIVHRLYIKCYHTFLGVLVSFCKSISVSLLRLLQLSVVVLGGLLLAAACSIGSTQTTSLLMVDNSIGPLSINDFQCSYDAFPIHGSYFGRSFNSLFRSNFSGEGHSNDGGLLGLGQLCYMNNNINLSYANNIITTCSKLQL